MALDTTSSDHDIILCLKDGGGRSYGQCHLYPVVIWFCVSKSLTVGCLLQLMFVLSCRLGSIWSAQVSKWLVLEGRFQVARKNKKDVEVLILKYVGVRESATV